MMRWPPASTRRPGWLRSADGTLAEVPRKVRSNMIERWFHPFGAAGCHGEGVQAYYISDARPPDRSSARPPYLRRREPTPWSGFFAALTTTLFGRLNLRSMPTLSSTRTETLMALQLGKPKMPASSPGGRGVRDAATRPIVPELSAFTKPCAWQGCLRDDG